MAVFLFSMLIFMATEVHAGGPPRLASELPTKSGCELLLKYSRPESRIEKLSPDEAADELVDLLSLTHPLVIIYLSNTDFHGDVRLLSLLWGNQYSFDLRRAKHWGDRSPFEVFLLRSANWEMKELKYRMGMASEFVSEISAIEWNINRQISGPTIYVGNHTSKAAFQTERPMWMPDFPRHWEVNDDFNVALRLHETIHGLRLRIQHDPLMSARLQNILVERLPIVMKPTIQFLKNYLVYLDSGDPDEGFIRIRAK